MKVLVELNLSDPRHATIFDALRGPTAPPEYTNAQAPQPQPVQYPPPGPPQGTMAAYPPTPQAPMQYPPPGMQMPASPSLHPALPGPTVSQAPPNMPAASPAPLTGQAAIPTPVSDKRQQLTDAFIAAYAVKPAEADQMSTQFREQFGPDPTNWTEQQVDQGITLLQSLATM